MTAAEITEPLPPVSDPVAYFRELARRQRQHDAGEAWRRMPYPAPVVASTDAVLPDPPAPVARMAALAEGWGWQVVRQFSHGSLPHATTGRPGPARRMHALLMARPEGQRAVACYREGSKAWAWESLWAWSATRLHVRLTGVDAVMHWLSRGAVNPLGERWTSAVGETSGCLEPEALLPSP